MTGMGIFRDWKLKLEKLGLEETHIFKIATVFEYQKNLTLKILKISLILYYNLLVAEWIFKRQTRHFRKRHTEYTANTALQTEV